MNTSSTVTDVHITDEQYMGKAGKCSEDDVEKIISERHADRGGLISLLGGIQDEYGYLPRKTLRQVAEQTGASLVDVYGVATFYKSFRLEPRGEHLISVCMGTTCHVKGAPLIVEEFERQLGIRAGGTTQDNQFSLETVNCLGACALAPVVVIDNRYFPNVKTTKIKTILRKASEADGHGDDAAQNGGFPLEVWCPRCQHSLMDETHLLDEYPSIALNFSYNGVSDVCRISSLYGSNVCEYTHSIPLNTTMQFSCPYCTGELRSVSRCPECAAPMIPMMVSQGGMMQLCTRHGCHGRMLDLHGDYF